MRSQGGFVSKLLLHPEILEGSISHKAEQIDEASEPGKPAVTTKGSSSKDADLTRQVGDTAVYMYYLRTIGWKLAVGNVFWCIVFALALRFPCKWHLSLRLRDVANDTCSTMAEFLCQWHGHELGCFCSCLCHHRYVNGILNSMRRGAVEMWVPQLSSITHTRTQDWRGPTHKELT